MESLLPELAESPFAEGKVGGHLLHVWNMLLESQPKVGKHILDIWAVFLESPENVGRHLPLF